MLHMYTYIYMHRSIQSNIRHSDLSIQLLIHPTPLLYAYHGLGPYVGPRSNQRLYHGQVAITGTHVEGCESILYTYGLGRNKGDMIHQGKQCVSHISAYTCVYIYAVYHP
jgi:hypothetical protein